MNKQTFLRGRPIIQPGEVYEINGSNYEVITATSDIVGVRPGAITLTGPVFWLRDIETDERVYMTEKELQEKIKCRC